MPNREHEYAGLLASTWDVLRGDTSGWPDRRLYRDLIARFGTPALDVGCGTGRLLLDFLAEGLDLDGVDNSPEMLALCREKADRVGLRPNLYEQWMESLELPRRYRTILVPSSSFQLLTEPQDAEEAMRRFFAHLEPGGALVMPFMVFDPAEPFEWRLRAERPRLEDGATVRRWSRSWNDVESQLQHTWDRFEVIVDGTVIASEERSRSPAVRWYTQVQAVERYTQAGFFPVELMRGFSSEPAGAQDALFTVIGLRPRVS